MSTPASTTAGERDAVGDDRAIGPRAGRCYRCCKPALLCICDRLEVVANRTRVTILQHPRERLHPLGTARIAALGLARASLVIPRDVAHRSLAVPPITSARTGLLYPSSSATPLETLAQDSMPRGLIVLDGTWSQSRGLYRENPWLAELPHYALHPSRPTRYRIRRAPRPSYISSVEAIVAALQIIEPETQRLEHLLAIFDAMIDDQIAHAAAYRRTRRPERKLARLAESAKARNARPTSTERTGCVNG